MNLDLNKLKEEVFEVNKSKGFHDNEISNETLLMLVITEISEAVEADRKDKRANLSAFKESTKDCDQYNKPDVKYTIEFESFMKDTVEDELADVIIRLLDLAGLRNINLELPESFEEETHFSFSEMCFYMCFNIFRDYFSNPYDYEDNDIETVVNNLIADAEFIANKFNINIWEHVSAKIEYNKTRSFRHGNKKY